MNKGVNGFECEELLGKVSDLVSELLGKVSHFILQYYLCRCQCYVLLLFSSLLVCYQLSMHLCIVSK